LRPIPTTSKGLPVGREKLNRISFFYKVFNYFSRFSKNEFRDERRNSILKKAFGTGSLNI
jgi:hypothetical protein